MKAKIQPDYENLTHAAYVKEFKRLAKMAETQANGEENAVTFFVKRMHKFACGTEAPLMLLSKMDAKWKKQAKEDLKGDKKMILIAKAHFTASENGNVLELSPIKGNAPLAKIAKEGKALLKKAKFALVKAGEAVSAAAEGAAATEGEEEAPKEAAQPTTEDSKTTETTETTSDDTAAAGAESATVDPQLEKKKAKGRQVMAKMLENLQKIEAKLKK
ncbi:hypothetical protein SapgrDRAFT_1327 [Saprospira grandis DSM 2844]|uniref:Uncharacterized protein n=1 Tax=Saprospira grandis DSM 2844 TaxID=694433 RepID=J1I2V2_9BACT|nr:hypothetical protein [Saprospira grandis]EJF53045.1 hypothetical protein SapgrDRAFT_1327 [Saprospira grandis DSM 2844]